MAFEHDESGRITGSNQIIILSGAICSNIFVSAKSKESSTWRYVNGLQFGRFQSRTLVGIHDSRIEKRESISAQGKLDRSRIHFSHVSISNPFGWSLCIYGRYIIHKCFRWSESMSGTESNYELNPATLASRKSSSSTDSSSSHSLHSRSTTGSLSGASGSSESGGMVIVTSFVTRKRNRIISSSRKLYLFFYCRTVDPNYTRCGAERICHSSNYQTQTKQSKKVHRNRESVLKIETLYICQNLIK